MSEKELSAQKHDLEHQLQEYKMRVNELENMQSQHKAQLQKEKDEHAADVNNLETELSELRSHTTA